MLSYQKMRIVKLWEFSCYDINLVLCYGHKCLYRGHCYQSYQSAAQERWLFHRAASFIATQGVDESASQTFSRAAYGGHKSWFCRGRHKHQQRWTTTAIAAIAISTSCTCEWSRLTGSGVARPFVAWCGSNANNIAFDVNFVRNEWLGCVSDISSSGWKLPQPHCCWRHIGKRGEWRCSS